MATITTHYKVHILKTDTHFKLTYRGKRFTKLERIKGVLSDSALAHLGRIIPPTVADVPKWEQRYKDSLTITEVTKSKTPFRKYSDAWFQFYEQRTGIAPKFTGADTNHLKQIIAYLSKITGSDDEALQLWQAILHNWKHLDEFHQKNTDIKYINSSLNKILHALKENTSDSGQVFANAVNSDTAKSYRFS